MPDPLLGFALQSFAPPVQPFAVSGAVALLLLERLSVPPESRPPVASAETPRRGRPFPMWVVLPDAPHLQVFAPHESPPHHAGGLGRTRARSSLGILPLQGILPRRTGNGLHRASPHEVARLGDESTARALYRVSLPDEIGWSLSRLPTLLGFTTS
jgi:hypothetical protein